MPQEVCSPATARLHRWRGVHPRAAEAFTLIELLAVIAVVAILAALVVPAIQGAMMKAKRAEAVSNIRELGMAHLAYANEHGGKLPPLSDEATPGGNTAGNRWMDLILPHLGYDMDYPAKQRAKGNPLHYPEVFYNPLVERHFPWTDFGVNRNVYTRPQESTRLVELESLRYIMLMDAGSVGHSQWDSGWMIQGRANPDGSNVAARPDNQLSAVFFDGSVRTFDREYYLENSADLVGPNLRLE